MRPVPCIRGGFHGAVTQPGDRVRRFSKTRGSSRIGVGVWSKLHGSGRVGSGQEFFKCHMSGLVTLARSDPRVVIRPVKSPGISHGFSRAVTRPGDRVRRFLKTCGSSRVGYQKVVETSRVGRVGSVGSSHELFQSHGSGIVTLARSDPREAILQVKSSRVSGRVGSGRVGSGRVGWGRVRSGRVGVGFGHSGPIRLARSDSTLQKPPYFAG